MMKKITTIISIVCACTFLFASCKINNAEYDESPAGNTAEQDNSASLPKEEEDNELPDGFASETLAPRERETKGIITAKDGRGSIDVLGVWSVDVQKTVGAKNEKDNIEIPYMMISMAMPPVFCFNNDGTGFEEYNRNRDSFTWEYIIQDDKKTGVVYRYDKGGSGWLLYLKQAGDNVIFEKTAYDGSDAKYGDEFIRTIEVSKRDPYILVYFEGGIHTPYCVFTHANTMDACGEPINANDIKELFVHKVIGNFYIEYYGQLLHEPSFTIYKYDENFDIDKKNDFAIYSENRELIIPDKSGVYLVQVNVVWGVNENNWSSNEFFFKIEIE